MKTPTTPGTARNFRLHEREKRGKTFDHQPTRFGRLEMIVLPLIIRILLICNNVHNKSDNNYDNLTIITVTMRIIIKIIH